MRAEDVIDVGQAEPTPAPTPRADRLNMHLVAHHEHCCDDPASLDCRWSESLASTEEPYKRRSKPATAPQPIDTGWLPASGISHIILRNTSGQRASAVQPTPAELAAEKALVIYVGFAGDDRPLWRIRPGKFMVGEPADLPLLRVWAAAPGAELTVVAYPN